MASLICGFILIFFILKKNQDTSTRWIIMILITYCIVGPASVYAVNLVFTPDLTDKLNYLLDDRSVYLQNYTALFSLIFGVIIGIPKSNQLQLQSITVHTDSRFSRHTAQIRINLVSALLCLLIITAAFINYQPGQDSEQFRLTLLNNGYWPAIIALFGWMLPFLCYFSVQRKINNGINIQRVTIFILVLTLTLSIFIGFRTYILMAVIIITSMLSARRVLNKKTLFKLMIAAAIVFAGITYLRVEGGGNVDIYTLAFSIFRRLSLEPLSSSVYVFDLVENNGYFLGQTLLMDLLSKMPGRQETFAGMLGQIANFEEGLTLTPSGILETWGNFGIFGILLITSVALFLRKYIELIKSKFTIRQMYGVIFLLFAIEFIMGGSSAFFDLFIRIILLNIFFKIVWIKNESLSNIR